jgi:ATP-dependent RNA helicase DeaD
MKRAKNAPGKSKKASGRAKPSASASKQASGQGKRSTGRRRGSGHRRAKGDRKKADPPTEQAPARSKKTRTPQAMPAWELGPSPLSPTTLAALAEAEYLEPTPVQAGVIPRAMEGVDLMGQARTGTGKTAAFAVPILEQLQSREEPAGPQALVLAPTRELAAQVQGEFVKLSAGRTVSIAALVGGKPLRGQTNQLRRGADVIVGTPGRVLDHIDRRTLVLDRIRVVVLDEADRMLDIGFRPDIEKILRRCPSGRQTLLLSATIPPPVARLARRYMHDPEVLDFSPREIAVETIEQFYFTVDARRKFDLLVRLLRREDPHQAIIFCRTRRGTEKVSDRLGKKFDHVASIHGDLPQRTRDRVMARFREGKIRYLAATDVVGRGIDVTTISHIINYDVPQFCDDYIHRVGRAGRMGREGVAYTFVTPEEGDELTRIEMRINRLLQQDEIPGFVAFTKPDKEAQPERKPVFGRRVRRVRRAL